MSKLLRVLLWVSFAATLQFSASSQSLSVNNTGAVANASSILDVSITVKGVLIPRMTKAQKNAIATPATGLLIFQTAPDSTGFQYFDGTVWVWMSNGNALVDTINWKTHGNIGLTDATSFLGNPDIVPINFLENNEKVGRLSKQFRNCNF